MQLEIIGTDGKVHYTRPHDHPDVWEALNTPGYSVRGTGEKQVSGSLHPAGSAASFDAGVWFQSACSGLWYQVRNAGGDISAVKIDGVTYQRQPNGPDPGRRASDSQTL